MIMLIENTGQIRRQTYIKKCISMNLNNDKKGEVGEDTAEELKDAFSVNILMNK